MFKVYSRYCLLVIIFSVPAIPSLAEVACVNVSLSPDFQKQMEAVISLEGKVMARAPVQIIDAIEKPGSLLLQWADEVTLLALNYFLL